MKLKTAQLLPFFLETPLPCGICQEPIEPPSLAHGHTWSYPGYNVSLCNLFHRTCIQEKLTNGPASCPNCECTISNADEYNQDSFLQKNMLIYKENRLTYLTLIEKRDFDSLYRILIDTKIIPIPMQDEALEIACNTNDAPLLALLLCTPKQKPPPCNLVLLLNLAASSGFDQIVSLLLQYNATYLSLSNSIQLNGFTELDIYLALKKAIQNNHFDAADLLLETDIQFEAVMLLNIFFLSYKHNYRKGMLFATSKGIPCPPEIFEKILRLAARKGDSIMIQSLFNEPGGNNINRESALLDAISFGHPEAALLLLEGAGVLDPNCRNEAVKESSARGFCALLQALLLNGPITKEACYWAQACAKNEDCLKILVEAQVF